MLEKKNIYSNNFLPLIILSSLVLTTFMSFVATIKMGWFAGIAVFLVFSFMYLSIPIVRHVIKRKIALVYYWAGGLISGTAILHYHYRVKEDYLILVLVIFWLVFGRFVRKIWQKWQLEAGIEIT